VLFLRWQSSWTSSPYPKARQKRRRGRKRRKLPNNKTRSYPRMGSSPSPQEPNTSLVETVSHRQAHHLPHPQTLHLLHVPGLLGFRRHSLRVRTAEVVLGPLMGWTAGRRLRSGLGRKGKQGVNMRILHPQKGGSAGLCASRSAPVLTLFISWLNVHGMCLIQLSVRVG